MALHKIPGSKGRYMSDTRGLRELGASSKLGDIALVAAWRGAALGRQYDPRGEYTAEKRTVRAGWNHDPRAGAVVKQVKAGPKAIQRMVMADILMGMESGRGSSRIP